MSGVKTQSSTTKLGNRSASQFAMEEIIRPLAIAGMMACIASAIDIFIRTMAPHWPGTFFIVMVFLVSLESTHAQRLLSQREAGQKDVFRFRFVEWVVILLALRFGLYLNYGFERLLEDMSRWGEDLLTFLSADYMMLSLLMLVFWAVSAYLSKAVQELESSPFEKPPVVTDPDFYLRVTVPQHGQVDRRARIHGITTTYFLGGAVIIALTGLAQMDIRNLAFVSKPTTPAVLNVMLYYVIGLLLISQVQYTTLKANWENQGIYVSPGLGKRWMAYVLVFLLLVGIISALLPVNYSVGILSVISTVVRWIAYVILQFVYIVIVAVTYLFMLIGSLFKNQPLQSIVQPTPIPTPVPPQIVGGARGSATWFQIIKSLLFWGILLGVATYAILRFLNDRLDLFRHLKNIRLFHWLAALFAGIGAGSTKLWHGLKSAVQRQVVALHPDIRVSPPRRKSWKKMTTRERVQFLYLTLLEYAAAQGLGRPRSATPLEYEQSLASSIPEGSQATHQLTESFIVARYSDHIVDDELVAAAQMSWRDARKVLNERRRRLAEAKAQT